VLYSQQPLACNQPTSFNLTPQPWCSYLTRLHPRSVSMAHVPSLWLVDANYAAGSTTTKIINWSKTGYCRFFFWILANMSRVQAVLLWDALPAT